MNSSYRTTPSRSATIPEGIPFIIANELAERFSYYGMRAILIVFMTHYLVDAHGQPDLMSPEAATAYYHLFIAITYLTPFFGALLADGCLGKYRTIILLSLVYCLGHFVLALDITRTGLLVGQSLIALGAGGIKPCVSAHLGDQFSDSNQAKLNSVFSWFYLAINTGAFISMLLVPWLLEHYGAAVAFALPGVLMALATFIFWSGRYRFVHIPAAGFKAIYASLKHTGTTTVIPLLSIYGFIAVFWSLFDQIGSAWVLQAEHLHNQIFGITLLPAQLQAANPLLIMLLTPLFYQWLYPRLNHYWPLTYMNKMTIGLFIAALAFAWITWVQLQIDHGMMLSIAWQLPAYVLLTAAEIMISVTCLEFSYTQAPYAIKSLIMAFYLASVGVGNLLTSLLILYLSIAQALPG
ncbi:POT-type proton-dependent oligopeptide transporter [Methylocucumis oryzae]|uniref:POT-type proton-dependent oligopeptide transporter n=1 Tax=Methylocucumis oryzae TaxID=1632867 RepID=UPI000AE46A5A|nr:MFS transporter [Methylocucumis oryzae]